MILVKNQNRPSEQVSKFRLYLIRGLYLLTFIGLAFQTWETILFPSETLDYITGVAYSFWAAYATLMGLGIRYPIKMLPLLLLQLFYKATWALGVYLPMQAASQVTPEAESFFWICIVAVILDVIVIPWPYIFKNYIKNFLNLKVHPE